MEELKGHVIDLYRENPIFIKVSTTKKILKPGDVYVEQIGIDAPIFHHLVDNTSEAVHFLLRNRSEQHPHQWSVQRSENSIFF